VNPTAIPQNARATFGSLFGGFPVEIDFEFNRSSSPTVNLVSCSYSANGCPPVEVWLHNSPTAVEMLAQDLKALHEAGAIFVGYAIAAEARSFEALGLDPHHFRWVDLYAEWCQLTFNNESCEYGTYFTKTGFRRYSVAPSFDKSRNRGKDNNKVGRGLVDCTAQLFGVWIDSERKKAMRDLIIADHAEYSPQERDEIMAYCTTDIAYLAPLAVEMFNRLQRATKLDTPTLARVILRRASYSVSIGKMETIGFPLKLEWVHNLRRNYERAQDALITNLVETQYPFFVRERKRASQLIGQWCDKYTAFEEYLKANGLFEKWPRTIDEATGKPSSTLSRDERTLSDYDGIPAIKAYRTTKKLIGQLKWFKAPDEKKLREEGDFFDAVGPDGRLRTFLGPFGTQTGRNAPKASRFVLAMSAWLRCLIAPPPGFVIIGHDYASQEFGIAAVMSKDPAMSQAYVSGDPYLYFAKAAGAVPQNADPKFCKDPNKAPPEEIEQYKKHKEQRGLFKSCLGENTLIRVRGKGYKTIPNILPNDYIWDGGQWVQTDGAMYMGTRSTILLMGQEITPDHPILNQKGGWTNAEEIAECRDGEISEKNPKRFQGPGASWADVWSLAGFIIRSATTRR